MQRGQAGTLRVIILMQQKLQSGCNAFIVTISPFCTCFNGNRVDIVQIRDKINVWIRVALLSLSLSLVSLPPEWDT